MEGTENSLQSWNSQQTRVSWLSGSSLIGGDKWVEQTDRHERRDKDFENKVTVRVRNERVEGVCCGKQKQTLKSCQEWEPTLSASYQLPVKRKRDPRETVIRAVSQHIAASDTWHPFSTASKVYVLTL